MTYTVIVLDRGRPIAKHPKLEPDVSQELLQAYRAMGWPEERLEIEEEPAEEVEQRAA